MAAEPGDIGTVLDGSDESVGSVKVARDWRLAAWDRLRPAARPAVAIGLVLVAYHTSLQTLVDGLTLDTPLAHLALVPLIALVLAMVARRQPAGPEIHDRQLDWIVGIPLVVTALLCNLLLPARLSTLFWLWRIDLLTMPFFVAGVVVLLFGVRMLWRLRWAVMFLFLAWPWPYSLVLDRWLGEFTALTIAGLNLALRLAPIAVAVTGGDGSTFAVHHGTDVVQLSVASACSGANGLVGFLLVGGALLLVVDGTRKAKFLWLAVGAGLVWLLNLARIMFIFQAAKSWGERVAIDGFHPFIGLVVFNIAIVVMVLLMGRFRLRLRFTRPATPGATPPSPPKRYRPSWRSALGVLLVATLGISVLNSELSSADLVATSLGSPRLSDFQTSQERPAGWDLQFQTEYTQYKRFFGGSSTWRRYVYSDRSAKSALVSTMPVIADVIETGSRSSLVQYGIEACYQFHGFEISKQQSVDLGAGVVGGLLTWSDPKDDTTWTTLYWHWPIKSAQGTRWERVTLLLRDAEWNEFVAPPLDSSLSKSFELSVSDALQGSSDDEVGDRLAKSRGFLVAFGQDLVSKRMPAP